MKRALFGESSASSEPDMNEELQQAVSDVITESNEKTVEIKPADESKTRSYFWLIALIGGVIVVGYWLRTSQKPAETLQSAASETADRTKEMTERAADTIEEGGETMAERVEEESQKAGEQVQETGENAAEKTEQAGETAAEKADDSSSSSSSS